MNDGLSLRRKEYPSSPDELSAGLGQLSAQDSANGPDKSRMCTERAAS